MEPDMKNTKKTKNNRRSGEIDFERLKKAGERV